MKATKNEQGAEDWVMDQVSASMRILPPALEQTAVRSGAWSKGQVRLAVRRLVESGALTYTQELGASFLERRFSGLARLGRIVSAAPPGHRVDPGGNAGGVVLRMNSGAAFGCGRHPTTRMAVELIEMALAPGGLLAPGLRTRVLDVGTGSGVLALSALLLGMEDALCTDVDPCARFEAGANARLNGLEGRMRVVDAAIPEIRGIFPLVLANLRLPTLFEGMPFFSRLSPGGGVLAATGVRPGEEAALVLSAEEHGFSCIQTAEEQNWAAAVFVKESSKEL